jgi:hypothetical protein
MTENWQPIITVYQDETLGRVGSRIIKSFDASPSVIAGILINILDMLIDKIPEQDQIAMEEATLDIFKDGLIERYNYSGKEPFDDEHS